MSIWENSPARAKPHEPRLIHMWLVHCWDMATQQQSTTPCGETPEFMQGVMPRSELRKIDVPRMTCVGLRHCNVEYVELAIKCH